MLKKVILNKRLYLTLPAVLIALVISVAAQAQTQAQELRQKQNDALPLFAQEMAKAHAQEMAKEKAQALANSQLQAQLQAQAQAKTDAIKFFPLAPADVARFLSGRSGACTPQVRNSSGELIGVIHDRSSMLVRMNGEISSLSLLGPRYSKNIASYEPVGESSSRSGTDITGTLEIKTSPNLSKDGDVERFSALLTLQVEDATKRLSLPLIIEDKCGAKSRLFHGPGVGEIIQRLLAR